MKKVASIGEVLFEFIPPQKGVPFSEMDSFLIRPGGAPANVCVAVSKLGGSARFIGAVGQDPFGEHLKNALIGYGVEPALVSIAEANTGLSFVTLRDDGDREFTFYRNPSADMRLRPEDLDDSWFTDICCLHFGTLALAEEPCRSANIDAIARARNNGAIVSFDPNIRMQLWKNEDQARQTALEQLPSTDILKVSEEELQFLYKGASDQAAAANCFAAGVKVLIVSMGERGCRVMTSKSDIGVESFPVVAVDTTGAGDGLVGGMLRQIQMLQLTPADLVAACSDDSVVREIFQFANAVAASSVTKYGAMNSYPDIREVDAMLRGKN